MKTLTDTCLIKFSPFSSQFFRKKIVYPLRNCFHKMLLFPYLSRQFITNRFFVSCSGHISVFQIKRKSSLFRKTAISSVLTVINRKAFIYISYNHSAVFSILFKRNCSKKNSKNKHNGNLETS